MAASKKALAIQQREQAFIVRYPALLKWTCRYLTGNDVAKAEDLLQDCFISYVYTETNTIVENLDGYLRRMLTYMLRSELRRSSQRPIVPLTEAHDVQTTQSISATIEEQERQRAIQRQLRVIYDFAVRRSTPLGRTKGGRIFILRYFRNKSGAEVAKLTGSTRGAVDRWVWLARQQIRKRYKLRQDE